MPPLQIEATEDALFVRLEAELIAPRERRVQIHLGAILQLEHPVSIVACDREASCRKSVHLSSGEFHAWPLGAEVGWLCAQHNGVPRCYQFSEFGIWHGSSGLIVLPRYEGEYQVENRLRQRKKARASVYEEATEEVSLPLDVERLVAIQLAL